MEWLAWFSDPQNTKPLALLIFFVTFCLVIIYVYGSRKRGDRLESYKNVPFLDEDSEEKGKQK